jgi:phosphopentomutase
MNDGARVIIIVLDSLGVGAMPDAGDYGDEGSDTLGNMARSLGGLCLPNLEALGLGNIGDFPGIFSRPVCNASYGKMAEASAGKDTTTGHWEMMGIRLEHPFPLYPHGFPPEVIEPFMKAVGTGILGNKAASGTEIIKELGEEHLRTGFPIVYTSADSVFQIAAHKDVIPLEKLYAMCEAARRILTGIHGVGRVIARPFTGPPGSFTRTHERRDFSLVPPDDTLLDIAKKHGCPVVGIGKIEDIFAGRGLTEAVHTVDNLDGMVKTLAAMERVERGIIFTNLVEFDMLYGHRNDPAGYYKALREFDAWLPEATGALSLGDMFIITADHGCDPTTPSTDHSREYVPLIVCGPGFKGGVDLGVRESFSDLGATAAEHLGVAIKRGKSFLREICAHTTS